MNIKMIGSSLIIAGTALGAGMLAIPMVLAQFGLLYGSLLMVLICFGTTYAALLLLEATIKAGGGLGLNSIARKTLGKQGQLITNGLLYALLICLLMAYILGAGDLLSNYWRAWYQYQCNNGSNRIYVDCRRGGCLWYWCY